MEQIELNVDKREELGQTEIRKLRSSGLIPGIVYSEGKPGQTVKLSAYDYDVTVSHCSPSQLFRLRCADKTLDGQLAFIKEVQMEPLKEQVLHIDFLSVSEGQTISMTVPLELSGECEDVKLGLATLNQTVYELEVECVPKLIPSSVTLSVDSLAVGNALHASDVQLPEGVSLRTDPEAVVVSAVTRRAVEEEEGAKEAEEGVEGEEAEAAAEGAETAKSAKADAEK